MSKQNIFSLIAIFIVAMFLITSCGSTPKKTTSSNATEPQITKKNKIDLAEDEVQFIDDDEEQLKLNEYDEYLRSIDSMDSDEFISKTQFTDDKAEILRKISELSKIMEKQDVNAWLKHIDNESKTYYSNPANLRKAQKKLPNKAIELKRIDDYFLYVFIPARKLSQVDEIRYISASNIKAVQVKADFSTVVYYYFRKVNGQWLVHLPEVN